MISQGKGATETLQHLELMLLDKDDDGPHLHIRYICTNLYNKTNK